MKPKPTRSKTGNQSFHVLHPISLGIKKPKPGKNELKKKVRFNKMVKYSSSDYMLHQRCLQQPLFQAEYTKEFELKSQSYTDVAGCSKMLPENLRRSSNCLTNNFQPVNFLKLYRSNANIYHIVGLQNCDLIRHLFNLQCKPRKGILKHKYSQNPDTNSEETCQSYDGCCEKKISCLGSPEIITAFPPNEQIETSPETETIEFLKLNDTIYLPVSNEIKNGTDVCEGTSCEDLTSSINSLHISSHTSVVLPFQNTYSSKQMVLSANSPLVFNLSLDENMKFKISDSHHQDNCYKSSYSMDEQMSWADKFINNSNNNANSSGPKKASGEVPKQDQNHNNQTTQCSTLRKTSEQGRNGLPSETCKAAANQSGNSSQQEGHTIDHLTVGIHAQCGSSISFQGELFNHNSARVLNSSVSSSDLPLPSRVNEEVLKSHSEKLISQDSTTLVSGTKTHQPSGISVRGQISAAKIASDQMPHFGAQQNAEETQKRTDVGSLETILMATSAGNASSTNCEKQVNCDKQLSGAGVHNGNDGCQSKESSCVTNNKTTKNHTCDRNSASEILYRCPVLNCGMHFSNQVLLLKHISAMKHGPCQPMSTLINGSLSNQKPNFLCPLCGSIFLDEDKCFDHMLRQNHFRLMSPVSFFVYSCPQCLCFFQSLSKTLQHMDDVNHYNTAFSFGDVQENLNRASPIPVPFRLMVELTARCEKVANVLYCKDCHTVLGSPDQLLAHLNRSHMVISKCCKSITDVFSSLITDQACAECHQYIYQGLPSTGLCIHTDCPLQGPVLALKARSLKEFILRCGITDINVATENNLDISPSMWLSASDTCTIDYSDSSRGKSKFYDGPMSEQSSRCGSQHKLKKSAEPDQSQLSCLTWTSSDNTCTSTSEQTLGAVALMQASSHTLHKNVGSTFLPSETFKAVDKDKPQTQETLHAPHDERSAHPQMFNSIIHDIPSAVVERFCPSPSYLQPTCSSKFSPQRSDSEMSQSDDSSSSDSTYKCSVTDSEIKCNCKRKNSRGGNGVDAVDSCSCSNCHSSCSSSSCSAGSEASFASSTDAGSIIGDVKSEISQDICPGVPNKVKVSSRYQCSIFEKESDASLESDKYSENYASVLYFPRKPDETSGIYNRNKRKPMKPIHEMPLKRDKNSQYFTPESVVNDDIDVFLVADHKTSRQTHKKVKDPSKKPTNTKALQIESDMDTGQPTYSDSLNGRRSSLVKTALKRKQHEDLGISKVKKFKPSFEKRKNIQNDSAIKNDESLYMLVNVDDRPERNVSFYTIDRNRKFRKRADSPKKHTANRRYDTRNSYKRTRGFSKTTLKWKPQFKNKQTTYTKKKMNFKTRAYKIKKTELQKKNLFFKRKRSRRIEQQKNRNSNVAHCKNQIKMSRKYKRKSKAERRGIQNSFEYRRDKKNTSQRKKKLCSLPVKTITNKQNSSINAISREKPKAHRKQMEQKNLESLNNCGTCKPQSKTTEKAPNDQKPGTSKGNKTDVKDLGLCHTVQQQSSDVDIVDIDEVRDRFFIVNESLTFDESCFIIDDNSTPNAAEKNTLNSSENKKKFSNGSMGSLVDESSLNVEQNCFTKPGSSELKSNGPVLRSSKAKTGKDNSVLPQNIEISKVDEKSLQCQPNAASEQVSLRPQDTNMAAGALGSSTSTMSLADEVCIEISDDDMFVAVVESPTNQTGQRNDHGSEIIGNLIPALGKKRYRKRRTFQTKKSKKNKLRRSHYKASDGKGLYSQPNFRMARFKASDGKGSYSQLNFRTARFKVPDLKSSSQFHISPIVGPSLMLRLDGPQCCSSHSESQLLSAKPQTTTTVPKSAQFKKLISPQMNHLASMERIIFADLENVMFFKVFTGSLSPSTFVWGFISARPNTPFHLEQYFCKYPLYNELKDADCVHISTEIGTSKDAVDFAMCLAIAKLDDRLPATIPFFIVSRDSGFREVENQMRASHRLVKLISPQGWSVNDSDFKS